MVVAMIKKEPFRPRMIGLRTNRHYVSQVFENLRRSPSRYNLAFLIIYIPCPHSICKVESTCTCITLKICISNSIIMYSDSNGRYITLYLDHFYLARRLKITNHRGIRTTHASAAFSHFFTSSPDRRRTFRVNHWSISWCFNLRFFHHSVPLSFSL